MIMIKKSGKSNLIYNKIKSIIVDNKIEKNSFEFSYI